MSRASRPISAGVTAKGFEHVPKNDKGGVLVEDADIEAAVKWLSKGKEKVGLRDLRDRLLPFYPEMPFQELRFLMGDKKELSAEDIKAILKDNTLTNFDPVSEAFDVFDIGGTGAVDLGFMSAVFHQLGYERLSEEDMAVILKTADVDLDGMISKDDFRKMLARTKKGNKAKHADGEVSGGGESSDSDSSTV